MLKIHAISGIFFDASKKYLIEMRLSKIAEAYNCKSYIELYQKTKKDHSNKIDKEIIDAISINETLFFRDTGPFFLLEKQLMPELIISRSKNTVGLARTPLRIWSSACATGQEVYSIAMILKESLVNINKYDIKLIGTDISNTALNQAKMGRYNKFEIERGLTKDKLNKYFIPSGGFWQVRNELRSMADFQHRNLMQPFNNIGKFDIIFCRNVAIYFTLEDRKKLFNKIADTLTPDGSLIIGSTESLTGICPRFKPKRFNKYIYYQLQ
jgi:chemotaxis protein methyltransferase CheR